MKILIRFGHGWGDTLMFMPIFDQLKVDFPDVEFDIYLENGQEEIFESYPNKNNGEHDLVFHLDFPMSEGSGITKAEKCCQEEIGIEYQAKFNWGFNSPEEPILRNETASLRVLPRYESPFVAVHFQGTALPNSVNCPKDIAYKIWDEIIEFGKIPIECHFEHGFHNPVNRKYSFINRDVRDCNANLRSLIGLIQHSFAFVGIASGPFVTALVEMPNRTLFIQNKHKIKDYTRQDIKTIDILNYKSGTVKEWLKTL